MSKWSTGVRSTADRTAWGHDSWSSRVRRSSRAASTMVNPRAGERFQLADRKAEFEDFLERNHGSLRQGGDRGDDSRCDELQPRRQRRDSKQQRSSCLHGVEQQVDSG